MVILLKPNLGPYTRVVRVAGPERQVSAATAEVASGAGPGPGRERLRGRRWLIPLGIAAAALVALAVAASAWLIPVVSDLKAARGHLLAGASLLQDKGLGLTAADSRRAQAQLAAADRDFQHAGARLDGSPLSRVLGHLPVIGTQFHAAGDLVDIGRHLSHAGITGEDVAERVRAESEAPNPAHLEPAQRFMALMSSFDPQLAAIDGDLRDVARARARTAHALLLAPLGSAFTQLDDRLARVQRLFADVRSLEGGLPQLFGGLGPRTYLVLQQDPAEARATGGFIGSIAFLSFDHGRMAPYQPIDIYSIDDPHSLGQAGDPRYLAPPAPFTRLIGKRSWELRDSNWSPDFPTAARQAEFLYRRETGRTVDGVIAIDPHLVASLLDVTGPVFIPETRDTVTSQNFFQKTLERVELHTPGTPKKAFLSYAARPIIDRVFSSNTKWSSMLGVLGRSCQARSLQAYFHDPAAQAMADRFQCSTRMQPLKGDGVMIVDSNMGATKDDFYVRRSFALDMQVQPDGRVKHTLYLHYDGLPAIPGVTSGFINWVRIYLPASATGFKVQGTTLTARDELGRRVMEGWVTFLQGQSASIVVTYETPRPLGSQANQIDVYWQKQPGRAADPIQLRLTLPSGWRLTAASGNSKPNGTAISTTLATDRAFSFRYSGG